jgi:hypothetical protein
MVSRNYFTTMLSIGIVLQRCTQWRFSLLFYFSYFVIFFSNHKCGLWRAPFQTICSEQQNSRCRQTFPLVTVLTFRDDCQGVITLVRGYYLELHHAIQRELFLHVPEVYIYLVVRRKPLLRCSWPPNGHPLKARHQRHFWVLGSLQ